MRNLHNIDIHEAMKFEAFFADLLGEYNAMLEADPEHYRVGSYSEFREFLEHRMKQLVIMADPELPQASRVERALTNPTFEDDDLPF